MTAKEKSTRKKYRYQYGYVPRKLFKGQCTERLHTNHHHKQETLRCPNKGLEHREGMCDECYHFHLKQHGIYPHKDNATRLIELYLIL